MTESLPSEELELLSRARGTTLQGIVLGAMQNCDEELDRQDLTAGYVCVTWGVVLSFDSGQVAITWVEDNVGDPFRIAVTKTGAILSMDSVLPMDVSELTPWSNFVGERLEEFDVLTYESNYGRPPGDLTWHSVPWAIRLNLGPNPLLVAAAHHEQTFAGPPCADEVVISYSEGVIRKLNRAFCVEGQEWQQY